jgi:aminopeptidase N
MQIDTALFAYASDQTREGLRGQVAVAVEAMLDGAKPGSDHQLQFAKSFANTAVTPDQFACIKSILGGSVSGLVIDAELRWSIFISGVKRGIFGPADIDRETENDKTAHGKQYGAMAYAAIPTTAAKSAVFNSVTVDDLSNTIHSYKILAGFVDQYFDVLLKVWETKGFEIAETTATLLFPSWVISNETVKKAQHWLDVTGKDASHALRRTVQEGRDAMTRALKARAAEG